MKRWEDCDYPSNGTMHQAQSNVRVKLAAGAVALIAIAAGGFFLMNSLSIADESNALSSSMVSAASKVKVTYAEFSYESISVQTTSIAPDGSSAGVDPASTIANADAQKVSISVGENGRIESLSNCKVEANSVLIVNAEQPAQIRIIPEDGYESAVTASIPIESTGNIITLNCGIGYGTINIVFTKKVQDQPQIIAQPETQSAVEEYYEAPVIQSYEPQSYEPQEYEPEPVYEPANPTSPQDTYNPPAPASDDSSSGELPIPNTIPNSMTAEERVTSESIFSAYNSFRTSRGLGMTSWSEPCANMAYAGAKACANIGQLVHRLGIPADVQYCYSDILQFADWRLDGNEAVQNWSNSTGHRRMMQCSTAQNAGVASYFYEPDYIWYYVIVYDFRGTNVGGN